MQNNDSQAFKGASEDEPMDDITQAATDALHARIAELEAANAELRETVLRERAEIENQRRRLHRDLEQARRFANEKLLNELLPVFDGLEGGLAVQGGDTHSMREGIKLTLQSLLKLGENHGMTPVDPLGQPLDPERHHAVSMIDAAGRTPGTVVTVLQKGYVLNDRLLRPALVTVASE